MSDDEAGAGPGPTIESASVERPPATGPESSGIGAETRGAGHEHGTTESSLRHPLLFLRSATGLTFVVIAVFTAVGAFVRLSQLGQLSIWVDEAQTTLLAFSILQHGYPIIVSSHVINNWEPLYPYLEALSIRLLGNSNFAYRLPSALLGTALIPIAYVVGARLRDRYVGIAFAGMVAFSTEYIAWSRQARWYILLVLLMVLGYLAALTWYRSRNARVRAWCVVAMVALAMLAVTASLPLFLLYVPPMIAAGVVYLAARRWNSVRRFFGWPPKDTPDAVVLPARFVPYRFRLPLIVALLATVIGLAVADPGLTYTVYLDSFTAVLGFHPYPPLWSVSLLEYLVNYYTGILAVAFLGGVFIVLRRDPFDLALVTFCVASLVFVPLGASFTTDFGGGGPFDTRHLLPLLCFLFLLASLGLVEAFQRAYRALRRVHRLARSVRSAGPVVFGVGIVAMLVLPSFVVPSGQVIYPSAWDSPYGAHLTFVAFSVDPQYPSALVHTPQPNFQLATNYILAHRTSGEIVAATSTGPPTVYLGKVAYWVRANPIPSTVIYPNGIPEFMQTGSVLVSNTSQLEQVLYTSTGWFISDAPLSNRHTFPLPMAQVVLLFMTNISSASATSILLFHWNQSTPTELVQTLIREVPRLNDSVGRYSLQGQLGWAVTVGITSDGYRGVLLPVAQYLLPLIKNETTRGHGVLFNLYNNRPDLQQMFPNVIARPFNNTQLFQWGCQVASGALPDPAYSALAPYQNVYCA